MTGHRAPTRAAQACKTPVEVAHEPKPSWAGYLHLDGKGIKLKGLPAYAWTAFLAQDSTGDVVHVALFEWGEQRELIRDFLLVVRDELHYPIRGVISDLREEIFWAVQQVWPGIPHQGSHPLWMPHGLTAVVPPYTRTGFACSGKCYLVRQNGDRHFACQNRAIHPRPHGRGTLARFYGIRTLPKDGILAKR